jgi:hypothetical protein
MVQTNESAPASREDSRITDTWNKDLLPELRPPPALGAAQTRRPKSEKLHVIVYPRPEGDR